MAITLVAIAAIAASTGAFAQSSVELYGVADIGYNVVTSRSDKNGTVKQVGIGAGGNSGNGSGNLQGGRFGLRGTEDLGNGLKAGFLMEYGVNFTGAGSDTATGNSGAPAAASENAQGAGLALMRQGGINLSSDKLGKVTLGTQYAYHDATSGALAGASATGGTNNVVGASNLLKYGYTGGQPRLANAVSYVTPTYMGVTLRAMRNQGKAVQDSNYTLQAANAMNANSFAADYAQGPLQFGIAQTKYSNVYAAAPTLVAGNAGMTTLIDLVGQKNDQVGNTAFAVGTADVTNRVAGGTYDFGKAKVGLNRGTYEANFAASATRGIKSTQTLTSIAVPVSAAATVMAGYTTGTIAQGGTDAYKTKGVDLIGVYNLSKRTNIYALWVQTKYDSQAASITAGTNDSAKQSQYSVGVRHSF